MGVKMDFAFKIDIPAAIRKMGKFDDFFTEIAKDKINQITEEVAAKAVINAPIDTERLRQNIKQIPAKRGLNVGSSPTVSGGVSASAIDPQTGFDYALVMHENLLPYGDTEPFYHVREKSASYGPQVGGKYLQRAVMEDFETYQAQLVEGLSKLADYLLASN